MASEPDREAEGAAPTEPRQARWRPGGPEPSAFMRLALRLFTAPARPEVPVDRYVIAVERWAIALRRRRVAEMEQHEADARAAALAQRPVAEPRWPDIEDPVLAQFAAPPAPRAAFREWLVQTFPWLKLAGGAGGDPPRPPPGATA